VTLLSSIGAAMLQQLHNIMRTHQISPLGPAADPMHETCHSDAWLHKLLLLLLLLLAERT
jgi:hypothetical protein